MKKHNATLYNKTTWLLLFVFLFLLFMLQLSAAEEIKLRFSGPDDFEKLTEENKKLTVKLFYQGKEEAYLYLPAGWDADNLRIWFSGTDWMEYENVRYKNGDRISFPLNEPGDFSIGDSGKTYRLTVMQSKSIPALFVCTDSNSMKHIDAQKGNREGAFLTIYNPDGKKAFSDRIKHIKSRGNSTFDAPKKPYQIKFNKKISSLAGMLKRPMCFSRIILINLRSGINWHWIWPDTAGRIDLFRRHSRLICILMGGTTEPTS